MNRKPLTHPSVQYDSLRGPDTWMYLHENLLSSYGKKLVCQDPCLSKKTIQELIEHDRPITGQLLMGQYWQNIQTKEDADFSFGIDDQESDAGLTVLSMFIKERPQMCKAELVAIYSELRRVPFWATAEAIEEVIDLNGSLGYYLYGEDGYEYHSWLPVNFTTALPARKKRQRKTLRA